MNNEKENGEDEPKQKKPSKNSDNWIEEIPTWKTNYKTSLKSKNYDEKQI